jgi:hypothetical protein
VRRLARRSPPVSTTGAAPSAVAKGTICREMTHVTDLQAAELAFVGLLEAWREESSRRASSRRSSTCSCAGSRAKAL